MNCDDLLKALNEFIDDESAKTIYRDFAEHLAGCDPCQVVVDNIRQTIALYKAGQPYPMPAEFQNRLKANLRDCWQRKFGEKS